MIIYYILYNVVSDEYYQTNRDQLFTNGVDPDLLLHREYVPLEFYVYSQAEDFVKHLPDYYAYEICERFRDDL